MENIKLKSCPFCGGQPITQFETVEWNGLKQIVLASIKCSACGVSRSAKLEFVNTTTFDELERCMIKAAENWNTRA